MLDCAIIGTGAAGISAALTLKALKRDFALIGGGDLSVKIRKAERIKNYPGLAAVDGESFAAALSAQLESEGIEITQDKVSGVYANGGCFDIVCRQTALQAKTVIFACGVESVKPIDGETEFLGKGVSYCATCDGFLYKGKTVAVVLASEEEEHEAEFLRGIVGKMYLFANYAPVGVVGANVEKAVGFPKRIVGGERVTGVLTGNGEIKADGVFVLKNCAAATLMKGLKTADGAITVDRAMQTNVAGAFAAGDCTGRPYQYAKAVGEGNVAAHSVNAYLNGLKV